MMVRKRISSSLTAIFVAAFMLVTPCTADENQKNTYRLEPVKVSAQKREEDVQEVPMSVSVLNDITLEEGRVTELRQLDKIVANYHMSDTGGAAVPAFMSMRGRVSTGADLTPTVAVLVDGVPYTDIYSVGNNLLFDVERVEVLRGPQSTMYGLNSVGGVINVITKQPSDTMHTKVYAEGSYGEIWDGAYMAGGSISGPLKEGVLRAGLAVMGQGQGGYIKNTETGERFNSDDKVGLKGTFNWTPTEAWDISGGLLYSRVYGGSSQPGLAYDDAAARALGNDFKKWEASINDEGFQEVENWAPNLNINYQFDRFSITSISAYRDTAQRYGVDMDNTPVAAQYVDADIASKIYTQEFRVQSRINDEDSLEWLAGYFYSYSDRSYAITVFMPGPTVMPVVDARSKDQSHSLFGQTTYRFFEKKFGVTAGFRQEWTTQDADESLGKFGEASFSDSQFLPKVAVDYRITPDHMVYASVTQGWRAGGISYAGATPTLNKFDKETCWSYELGAKTAWFDNKLQANAAIFYVEYDDYQDLLLTPGMTFELANAPKVTMKGVEADFMAQLSKSVSLSGSIGYTNATYVDFPDGTGDYNGNKVLLVPDVDANLALKYSFLENFYVRPEVCYIGSIYWDRDNARKQAPYALLNLQAGWAKNNYEIYLFGENLTNEYSFLFANDMVANGQLYGNPTTPMRFGLGARLDF